MLPMWFMLVTTVAALYFLVAGQLKLAAPNYLLVVVAIILFLLAIMMVMEAFKALKRPDVELKK